MAVSSPGVLLNHEGSGHQLKINKAGDADTGSLLFQSGFSGNAEIGLAGANDFSIKVSPDGQGWADALRIDNTTGIADFPAGITTGGLPIVGVVALHSGSQPGGVTITSTSLTPVTSLDTVQPARAGSSLLVLTVLTGYVHGGIGGTSAIGFARPAYAAGANQISFQQNQIFGISNSQPTSAANTNLFYFSAPVNFILGPDKLDGTEWKFALHGRCNATGMTLKATAFQWTAFEIKT